MDDFKEFAESIKKLKDNCEASNYLKKYGIFYTNESIEMNKFIILLYCMKNDKKENLQINFSMDYDLLFGKLYIKYSIFLKGVFQEEIYTRISYNLQEYKSNKLFTIANIYIDLINKGELDSDFDFEKKHYDFIQKAYDDLILK